MWTLFFFCAYAANMESQDSYAVCSLTVRKAICENIFHEIKNPNHYQRILNYQIPTLWIINWWFFDATKYHLCDQASLSHQLPSKQKKVTLYNFFFFPSNKFIVIIASGSTVTEIGFQWNPLPLKIHSMRYSFIKYTQTHQEKHLWGFNTSTS